jgi:selenocysteine lyase/cysteine desulfurase
LKRGIQERITGAELVTPLDSELSGGIVVFSFPRMATLGLGAVTEKLYRDHNIGCNVLPWGIRLSPHMYNLMDEIDRVVDAVKSLNI